MNNCTIHETARREPTNIADLFRNVCPDIRDVPHCHERVKARNLLSLLDVRLVCEAEVMGNGCQKHLHTDDEILRGNRTVWCLYLCFALITLETYNKNLSN